MKSMRGLIFAILFMFICGIYVSALNLDIDVTPVKNTIVNDEDEPALFDARIINNGNAGDFEIYTFEKFGVEPKEFSLEKGETKTIRLSFFADDPMKANTGYISTPFYFREAGGSDSQNEEVFIKLVNFNDLFGVKGANVNLDSTFVKVSLYNLEDVDYENVKVVFSSELFDDKEITTKIGSYEKKDFSVPINEDKFKKLVFGSYPIKAKFTVDGRTGVTTGFVSILEQAGLKINENKDGWVIREYLIEKINEGNVPIVAETSVKKNIISRLFTTFSLEPNSVERKGFFVEYFWQKELLPDEKLSVKATTNWLYPLIILVLIIVIIVIFNKYYSSNLVIKKSIGFVKTKDDRFALRVQLRVRARKFMEKVVIFDRLPGIANLYEHYGQAPTQVDKNSGRLKWNIGKLTEGEERIFSYIMHSKVKVVGKFELPAATGIYEQQGQIHETKSNRTFFINEPKEIKKAKQDF